MPGHEISHHPDGGRTDSDHFNNFSVPIGRPQIMIVIAPAQLRHTSVGVAVQRVSCAIKHIREQIPGSKRGVNPRTNRGKVRPVSIVLQILNVRSRSLDGDMRTSDSLHAWPNQRERAPTQLFRYKIQNRSLEVKEKRPIRHQQNVALIIGTLTALDNETLQLLSELLRIRQFLLNVGAFGNFRVWLGFWSEIAWFLLLGCFCFSLGRVYNFHVRAAPTAPSEIMFSVA